MVSTYSLPKFLPLAGPKDYYGLASGGLGFAVPGAVGISMALPGRPIAAMVGDGSAMYGIQGLWSAAHERLPVTYIVANNRGYRIIKERLVAMRSTRTFTGMDLRDPLQAGRFVSEDVNIHSGLGTSPSFDFGGQKIGPEGLLSKSFKG